jgi:hypothetical protein
MAWWDHEEPKDIVKEDDMAKWNTLGWEELKEVQSDNVNHPKHYGQGDIECIEYIADFLTYEEYIGYLRGNTAKYLHRWRYKNGLEDLKKAQWYLARLVEEVGNEEDNPDQT